MYDNAMEWFQGWCLVDGRKPSDIIAELSISQQCWKFLTGLGVCSAGIINLTLINILSLCLLTPLKPFFVPISSNKPFMSAFTKESAMSWMLVVDVVFQRQPLCYHHFTITTWSRHHTPVHVVDHALLPHANQFTILLFTQFFHFLAETYIGNILIWPMSVNNIYKLTFSNMPNIKIMFDIGVAFPDPLCYLLVPVCN